MKLSATKQQEIVRHVRETFNDYDQRMTTYREEMYDIYETVNNFRKRKRGEKVIDEKPLYEYLVNKAFEIENKIMPKVFGSNPSWIVSFNPGYENKTTVSNEEMADMVRDYLEDHYKKQDIREVLKLICKSGIRFGNAFAKIDYKYSIDRTKTKKEVVVPDMMGQEMTTYENVINESVTGEYPCIEYKSWTDMYYDPRYLRLEDMPALIEVANNVRASYFSKNKSKYMNIDRLEELMVRDGENEQSYKSRIKNIIGIEPSSPLKPTTLQVKKYYGYYDLSDDKTFANEKLYEFRTINDAELVYAKEILYLPFEDFRVFPDTEHYYAKGYIQSLIGLQNQLNHQKITTQEYINRVLYPPLIRSPNSGVDPRQLVNPQPGKIIVTTKGGQEAAANIFQLPFRDVPNGYRQNSNDLERQIQAVTFTIDTSNPLNQQALTNTATGARIKEFESNAVTGDTRKEFEVMMARIAYKMLMAAYDNMDSNIVVPKRDGTGNREVNKEAFKNALSKYIIRIEAGSSSFDSVEQRRNDALAQFNLSMQAAQVGVPVDLKYLYEKVMQTFEGIDTSKLFVQQDLLSPSPNAIGALQESQMNV